ncbi:MAG: septal ring lytic transglycosylase RlpA family lipoprotein [Candidatus Omnitrophica bacterium]|nr:septal ring lytic transglycosylase RlpA family lipoprotein [Candidatus Omnitrophota bacterium]
MRKWFKKVIAILVFIFVLDVGISLWILVHDLKSHYPKLDFSKAQFGVSSWYSRTDKGVQEFTANGEKFNDKKLTCATWDYPFNQRLVVINVANGKWVACRVNDRGPHKRLNREIDLTRTAFKKIANPKKGLIYVTIVPAGRYKPKTSR